jgi:hypothetical protein
MDVVVLLLEVGEDRRLTIQVPNDIPLGKVEVTLRATDKPLTREEARARLLAAGALSTAHHVPDIPEAISDEDLPIPLPPGSLSIDQIIDEDRGPR